MVLGQILRPFTGRDDVETGSAGPVDDLCDQCRLIAIGEGVDATCGFNFAG